MELISRDEIDYKVAGHSLLDIVNYNEVAVAQVMRETLRKDLSLCQCRFCVEDIYALSLNALPPRYIQPSSVHTYTSSRDFIDLDVVRQKVLEAISWVTQKPNHGK